MHGITQHNIEHGIDMWNMVLYYNIQHECTLGNIVLICKQYSMVLHNTEHGIGQRGETNERTYFKR